MGTGPAFAWQKHGAGTPSSLAPNVPRNPNPQQRVAAADTPALLGETPDTSPDVQWDR